MSTISSQFQRDFRRYRLRIHRAEMLKAFGVSGAVMAISIALAPAAFSWPYILLKTVLLLLLCSEWGRLYATPKKALARLYRHNPKLAETIHIALGFSEEPVSSTTAYFQQRHLAHLQNELLQQPLTLYVPFVAAMIGAIVIISSLVTLGVFLPQLPQDPLAVLVPKTPPAPDHRSYRVLYPAYMRKAPEVFENLAAQLQLPRGSRLEIYLNQADLPEDVQQESVYEVNQERKSLRWLQRQDRWIASLSPQHSGTLYLAWDGQVVTHEIEVIKDAAPQLFVEWPDQNPIFSNSSLSIALTATDDYGLQTITLHYQAEGKAEQQEIIQSFEGQFREYSETYPWELGPTHLRKGDKVTAWIEASDNDTLYGPNITKSEPFTFTIEDIKAYHEDIVERLWRLDAELGNLLSLLDRKIVKDTSLKEDEILAELNQLREDSERDQLLSDELRQLLFSELELQLHFYQQKRARFAGRPEPDLL